jgi:hypothetical protein
MVQNMEKWRFWPKSDRLLGCKARDHFKKVEKSLAPFRQFHSLDVCPDRAGAPTCRVLFRLRYRTSESRRLNLRVNYARVDAAKTKRIAQYVP